MKTTLSVGSFLLLVVALFVFSKTNSYPESPASTFLAETGITIPERSTLVSDEKESFGDGFRKILFTSTPQDKEAIIQKAKELGFSLRKPRDFESMFFMPDEMKTSVQGEELIEFYKTDGAKTVVVVPSSNYTFMWIGWI